MKVKETRLFESLRVGMFQVDIQSVMVLLLETHL